MKLILVRHGETEHNRTGVTLGRADVPLNERGRLQARAAAASFVRTPTAIYTSPLSRAHETAAAIARGCGGVLAVEEALIEMDVGQMEHLGHEELRSRYPDFLREWLEDPADARMPGGETLREVQDRSWDAIERLVAGHADSAEGVVAVTHNFVILTIACRALGLPLSEFRKLKTAVGGKTLLDMAGSKPALISWNDTSHLRATGLG